MKYKLISLISLFLITFVMFTTYVKAENIVKDSDFDGFSDTIEVGKYKTNPFKADTDEDGFSDYVEVKYKTDPNDIKSRPIVEKNNIKVDTGKYYWLFSRASGITAFILLSIGVCFGMGISTRSAYKFLRPPIALEIHNTINVIALFAVILHAVALLFDNYFYLKIQEALVPFLIDRKFKSELGFDFKIAIGLGIIAFYCIAILVITSLYRSKISIKLWRKIHYISFFTYITFVIHGIVSGTDSKNMWMQGIYLASMLGFIIMFMVRMKGVISKKLKPKPTPPASPTPQPAATTTPTAAATPVVNNKPQVSKILEGQ